MPNSDSRVIEGPDGELYYTREDGQVIVLKSWEDLNRLAALTTEDELKQLDIYDAKL